jgi:hypothetical protein
MSKLSLLSLSRFSTVLLTAAAAVLLALPALADSQARIVRLSNVEGSVQINKNAGMGFENAFLNLPITQGTQLTTHDRGRAEVEFEDGSTLRLTPNTTVEFSTLGVSDSGQRVSLVNLVEGMAYVNWLGKDAVTVNFSREKVTLARAAHIRLNASTDVASLAVFKGDVEVEGPAGKLLLEKKKTATFDVAGDDKYTLANNIADAPLDAWDKEANSYHEQYAKNNNQSPYGYGLSDMNYYGAYSNVPGYGMMWQPFFTGVGWDPFTNGAWSWYPGYGYMFASAYPWGWMPYRYGNWNFIPGMGWMWQPGGFNSWGTAPRFAGTMPVNFHPLVAPASGTVKTVVVGKGEPVSTLASHVTVNAGSAGLGIPRGSVASLGHLNHEVAKNGFAEVRTVPPTSSSRGSFASGNSSRSSVSSPSMGHSNSSAHASGGGIHH